MTCAYCKKDRTLTGEHLIPMSLIDMFPECDINVWPDKTFKSDKIVINDVCNVCNNGFLSDLDGYGGKLVNEYFLRTYEADDQLVLPYEHSILSRWLLKILFNNARSLKIDTTWFESNLKFLLGESSESDLEFSLFGGLAVDMTPLPEFFFDNLKLGVYFDPKIMKESILEYETPSKVSVNKRESESISINNLMHSAILRFGSGLFLVFLWDKDVNSAYKQGFERMMEIVYPYSLLNKELGEAALKRVTHAYNYHHYYLIDTSAGLNIADRTNAFLPFDVNPIQKRKEDSKEWDKHVDTVRENRALRRQREREKKRKNKQKNKQR
ncbi:hypothetical protein QNH48_10135 [Neobacillus sp. YX16]|uniref:hypothetical protein n=1 Tax=Neobacillus sp. YX16 TaxID=3047874 RepID=UPI0024C445ED|nr:hypothetical protein [Neobacillus sp. YX16]WHZ04947.1 hypothetical protein QNH48_10135 [Neobacillus sp. YX16]